jgi:hypothetical protein
MLYHHCFFKFAFEYAVRKAQENQDRSELNGTCQFLVYADHISMLDEDTFAVKRNTEAADLNS